MFTSKSELGTSTHTPEREEEIQREGRDGGRGDTERGETQREEEIHVQERRRRGERRRITQGMCIQTKTNIHCPWA